MKNGVEEKNKNKPQKLRCSVMNYDWGKIGEESQVAKLFSLNSGLEVEVNKPYAELWMGTHVSGPSFVVENGYNEDSVTLKSWILQNPHVLGDKLVEKFGTDLPFLMKVLSVAKALSIQAHPDKELAGILHKSHPNVYKDDNHKPEMALALTEFEALCGFVSLEELKGVFHSVPEIIELVGSADTDKLLCVNEEDGQEKVKNALRTVFTQLMSASKDAVSESVSKLINRLMLENKVKELSDKEQLVLQLEKQYPADVGVIAAFFLNYVKLSPGEALYLGANEPHAYLYGECIECMATSDSVVRAGLTPKYRDVQTLCSMLTYNQGFPEIMKGVQMNQYTTRYFPPFEEFEVDCCVLPQGASVLFPAIPGPSLFILTTGEGTLEPGSSSKEKVTEGTVLFVPTNTEISVSTFEGLRLYRAGLNSMFF